MRRFALITALVAVAASAQEVRLSISTQTPPPPAIIGQPYTLQLAADGGVAPYVWRMAEGSGPLPPGLHLEPQAGRISGSPTTPGAYSFRIAVSDSAGTPSTDLKPFVITVPDALVLDWDEPPRATKEGITGSVVVLNQTGQTIDLTVIIVAVNEVGKAFALAEQHFPLKPQADSPTISFGTEAVLPFGKYVIHADAVGEVASANQIYRTRKQTGDPFVIRQQ